MSRGLRNRWWGWVMGLWCALAAVGGAWGQEMPVEARIQEKPNAVVPLGLKFTDERGREVRLGDYFRTDRPVVLSMVYYNCPMLCNLTMNGMVTAAKPMKGLEAGKDYEVVWVSFNPEEKPELAQAKKANYMKELGLPADAAGWAFLTSTGKEARTLGEALGFGFVKGADGQYMHQAAIYICTPEGKVARVMQGVQFDSQELHDSLVAASKGKISTGLWGVALSCGFYHYDAASGKYVLAAQTLMRVTGILTVAVLATVIGTLMYRDAKRRQAAAGGEG